MRRAADRPWEGPRCTLVGLGRAIVMAAIQHDDEIPCDGCNGVRALCGGLPRKDGEAR